MVNENQFLMHAFTMGIFITFLYDILRIFRRVIPQGKFLVSMEDILFWIYCSAEVFLMMYHESDGTLRWFAVLGAMTGMLSYKKIISAPLVKYASLILGKLVGIIGKLIGFILRPVKFLTAKIRLRAAKTGKSIRRGQMRVLREIKLRLTFFIKMLKINIKA